MSFVKNLKKKTNHLISDLSYLVPLPRAYHSPIKLQLETSGVCNFRCKQCSLTNFGLPKNAGMLDYRSFVNIFKQFKWLRRIEPYGLGEAFLNKDLFKMIDFVKKNDPSIIIDITTNGSLINKETTQEIIKKGVNRINFSIDGAKAETYEKIRGGKPFAEIINNVKILVKTKQESGSKKPLISISMVVMEENINDLGDYVLLGKELGVEEVHLQEFNPIWDKSKKGLNNDLVKEKLLEARQIAKKNHINLTFSDRYSSLACLSKLTKLKYWTKKVLNRFFHRLLYRKGNNHIQCPLPWSGAYITNKGDVTPCCMIPDARIKSFGNVNQTDFTQIWNNQEFRAFRKQLLSGQIPAECIDCSLARR
ncbi:MAG: radical SAM protein [Nanoarchaeota archaeon]